jgi:L-aminopeptidase/D-esterase-like protein
MSLFDLLVGDARARPGSEEGYGACTTASGGPIEVGRVGAGAGATVDKWRGIEHRRPGGIGTATRRWSEVVVSALVAVNAYGGVDASPGPAEGEEPLPDVLYAPFTNTIIGLVATNAVIDKTGCHLVAQAGHDGIARAVFPPHTRYDGDALVAAATGQVAAGVEVVRALAVRAVEAAIRRAVSDPGVGGVARQ